VGVQFLVTTALARILGPAAFGLGNAATVVAAVVFAVSGMGFNAGLIVRREVSGRTLRQIVALNVGLVVMLTALLLGGADSYASAVGVRAVGDLIPWLIVGLVGSLASGPSLAILARALAFRRIAVVELASVGIAGFVAVGASGLGAFSLVLFPVCTEVCMGVFSLAALVRLPGPLATKAEVGTGGISYAARAMGVVVLSQLSRNVDNMVVAAVLGATSLAFYSAAYRLMLIPVLLITTAITRVALPDIRRMANLSLQAAGERVAELVSAVTYVAFPLLVWLLWASDPLISLLYGSGWGPAATALRILALGAALQVVTGLLGAAIQATTNMRALWWSNVIYAGCVAMGAFAGAQYGVDGVCVVYCLLCLFNLMWHVHLANKNGLLRVRLLMRDSFPGIAVAIICQGVVGSCYWWLSGTVTFVFISGLLVFISSAVATLASSRCRRAAQYWIDLSGALPLVRGFTDGVSRRLRRVV
jgi:PST family polysaccharide transporter